MTINPNRGMTLAGNGTLASANTLTYGGIITDNGGGKRLNKGNTGTVILTGSSNSWGLTTVTNGTLAMGAAGALPSAPIRTGFNDTNTCAVDMAPSATSTGFDLTVSGIDVDGAANGGGALTQTGFDKQIITNSGTALKTLTINNTTTNNFEGTIKGNLNLTKNNNSELILTGKNNYAGSTNVRGGTLTLGNDGTSNAWAPVLTNAGGADIQAGKINFKYSGSATTPAGTILTELTNSYAAGFATSTNRIRSTTATAAKGLGWKDDGAGAVTVADAYYGDATLDGTVDSLDFNQLATNFNKAGLLAADSPWLRGDFNYDGNVNVLDFNALASNYGKQVPVALSPALDQPLGALVPEPAALAVLFITVPTLIGRRRRHQR
jgi:fibronectin-binding autotransporter adhesin